MTFLKTVGAVALLSTLTLQAQSVKVEITNLSKALYYTPLLVAAHDKQTSLFNLAEPASSSLQAMAEGGDISHLVIDLQHANANYVENPAEGLLAPSASTTTHLKHTRGKSLSIVAMVLPSNDGFVGLNSWKIPKHRGTYTLYLNAYDAGTEANNEIINGAGAPGELGIPADPGGHAGTGGSGVIETEVNPTVHVHSGNLGDLDETSGPSDLNAAVHRWINPVAKVTVTVTR